jgi:hypothetical protein
MITDIGDGVLCRAHLGLWVEGLKERMAVLKNSFINTHIFLKMNLSQGEGFPMAGIFICNLH